MFFLKDIFLPLFLDRKTKRHVFLKAHILCFSFLISSEFSFYFDVLAAKVY